MMDDQCKSNPFSLIYHLFMLNLHAQGNKFMSTLKEKTASGLLWSALNSGLMQLLNAVIGIFLARLLLPADYGLVGMLTIFSAIATTLQESGFTSALTNLEHPPTATITPCSGFPYSWVSDCTSSYSSPLPG